jgi:phenylacetate-CoA ligase
VRPISVESLYRKAPRWLQSAAVAGVGAYLRWQRFGGEFAALLAEANGATFARPDELCAIRKRLWSERVRPAVKAVAAYGRRSIDLADVSTLPILTKEEVRGRLAEFVRADYPRLRRVWMHTSGSTGAGLQFPVTLHQIRRQYAYVWRYRGSHGIAQSEWCAVFGGRAILSPERSAPPYWQVNPAGRTVLYSQYHLRPETARLYLDHIRERRLRWIHGYPSVVGLLAQFGIDAGLAGSTDVRWITLSSENLLERQRKAIRRMFGVEPRQQYGMVEGVALVSECPEGRLHVDEDYSLVEFVPVSGMPGACRLVGTALDNEVFPLVRYQVGDIMRLAAPEPCPCGRSGRIVASIDGRQEDFLVMADGSRVGRVSNLFKDAVHVTEAQIVQKCAGKAVLRIVRGVGYTEADEASLRAEVYKRMGDRLTPSFEYVDHLPRTKSGKLRMVVSELPEARNSSSLDGLA